MRNVTSLFVTSTTKIFFIVGTLLFELMMSNMARANCDITFTPSNIDLGKLKGIESSRQQSISAVANIFCDAAGSHGFWLKIPEGIDGITINNLISSDSFLPYQITLENGEENEHLSKKDVFLYPNQRIHITPLTKKDTSMNAAIYIKIHLTPNKKNAHIKDNLPFNYNIEISSDE